MTITPPALPPVAPAAPMAAAAPHLSRGSVALNFLMGGTQGLATERARIQAEADRPAMQARMEQLRALATSMGPAAQIAFETNPTEFGKNLAEQYHPTTTSAGGISTVFGTGQQVAAPSFSTVNDTIFRNDPATGQSQINATAPPAYSDQTARFNAENPVLSANSTWVGPDGQPRASGYIAPDVTSVGAGSRLVVTGADGQVLNQVNPTPSPVDQEAAARAREGRVFMAQNMSTALQRARQYVDAAGVWSQYNPLNRQDRANLEGQLDTLKGNLTFDKLQEMKRNSPTGASGLGALSDSESRMLASTVAALNPDMSPRELERSFKVIDGLVAKMQQDGAAPASEPTSAPVRVTTPQEAQALPSGTLFQTPDGQIRRVR